MRRTSAYLHTHPDYRLGQVTAPYASQEPSVHGFLSAILCQLSVWLRAEDATPAGLSSWDADGAGASAPASQL